MSDVYTRHLPSKDPRLGRHVAFDERSRSFALAATIDQSTWRNKRIRIYDPIPHPNQCHGECTYVSKAMQFNAIGNREVGRILGMKTAHEGYTLATKLDPFPGEFPAQDTGSSTLAAAKAAQQLGHGGTFRYLFGGADEVVQAVMSGKVVNVGTRWDSNMFTQNAAGVVSLGGGMAGGHSWIVRGFDADRDLVLGRCWWGTFADFYIRRRDLAELLADDGDAHTQVKA